MSADRTSLIDLPTEILLDIHLLSSSENLPIICQRFKEIFHQFTTNRYRANYLWRKYILTDYLFQGEFQWKSQRKHKWDSILTNRCCTLEVLMILRKFHQDEFKETSKDLISSSLRPTRSPKIFISQLPTRLFKPMTSKDQIELTHSFQYISILLKDFNVSPKRLGGYPLSRSILSGELNFIRLFLTYGANPSDKDNLSIMIAIKTGDLNLVRMLIEVDFVHPNELEESKKIGLNYQLDGLKSHKKIRLEDRVKVVDEMLDKALKRKDYKMGEYFMGKGARPTLETLKLVEF
ncbi:uncharacterized protein MELLADRAFT_76728 [Melampsora larici-populina 98AG31]|uniref:Uncharacterized protein n=1 Tax=Melampsora larici-populina (strain 98AG31 / pathotype 3-4-7) TaxID=747676 RepID=F4R8Y2_MELLP|nr:uncharacterized protein MELLADRAFT_76728 [Melampsora larici-populina 98AG31]EGG10889.1 hypothetical protein MELLADRAFT_76728 [Melampsora larici-populina 98AG31]